MKATVVFDLNSGHVWLGTTEIEIDFPLLPAKGNTLFFDEVADLTIENIYWVIRNNGVSVKLLCEDVDYLDMTAVRNEMKCLQEHGWSIVLSAAGCDAKILPDRH